ncbi:MAG: polyprenyl synthetase family protein [Thermoplasmata archaeon]|nr:polyprenyl synthetase family protein [Thermoplasmata archaeon]
MSFGELAKWIPSIEREITRGYTDAGDAAPRFRPFLGTLSGFTLRGGKRFRALLILAGWQLATHRSPRPVLPAAAAMEHFQSWMLVHDDIIDHAETRRGGPAVHRALTASHRSHRHLGSSDEYGVGMGITLGDLQEPLTVEAFLNVSVSAERRIDALEEYARMTRSTAFGQLLDVHLGAVPVGQVRPADVMMIHRLKTAAYTVSGPLRIGALLGGGSARLLDDLEAIGTDLGVAFQMRDDVLGTGFGSELAGKSANDLVEGKRTLLVVIAWRQADRKGRAALERVLGKPHASALDVERAQDVIRSTGSLAYSERRISLYARRAYDRIGAASGFTAADRELLREIGDRLVHRAT